MPKALTRDNSQIQYRYLDFTREMVTEDGTIELSCSSETPVSRWWGMEVLGHSPGEIRLDRTKAVGSFLFAHGRDPNYGYVPLGPIVDVYLDEQERRVKAVCRFDPDEKSQLMKAKTDAGSIKGVSIGYKVNAWLEIKAGQTVRGFTGPCEIAVDWEILEISLEPTAADPSVGVGRSDTGSESERVEAVINPVDSVTNELPESNARNEPLAADNGQTPEEDTKNQNNRSDIHMTPEEIRAMEQAAIQRANERAAEINALCGNFPSLKLDATAYIRSDMTMDQINADVIRKLADSQKNTHVHTPSVDVGTDESDKFRAAAEDALLMRCGVFADKPAAGANELRSYTLFDLAIESLERRGEKVRGKDKREVADKALFSAGERTISLRGQGTSDFPLILANVANKVMRKAYEEVPTTYQQWVQFADAVDFKEISRPQFSESPDLDHIVEGGEYKSAEFGENQEKYKIQTYGKKFAVTRQTIINDDMNVLARVPALFGAAAARKVNGLVYKILTDNAALADGVALFHATHKNLAGTAAVVSVDSLGVGRAAMRKQMGIGSKATLNIVPRFIIIPAQLEVAAMQVIRSAFDSAKQNSVTYNPFTELTPVVDATLDANSLTAWYLAADPRQVDTVEVAFLNGQRTPYQEQRIGFDVDGLEMKVRIDVAAKALDFRGLYKNAGV